MRLFISLLAFSTVSAFAADTYKCNFTHTDIDGQGNKTDINHNFELVLNESKTINFPRASNKTLMVSINKTTNKLYPYSLHASLYRNYETEIEGELSGDERGIVNVNQLMYASAGMDAECNRIIVMHGGSFYDPNGDFGVQCEKIKK